MLRARWNADTARAAPIRASSRKAPAAAVAPAPRSGRSERARCRPAARPQSRAARRGVTEAGDLAVQHAFQALEHAFDAPAPAIQRGHLGGTDLARQVGPPPDRGLAILGRDVEPQFDAAPGAGAAFA